MADDTGFAPASADLLLGVLGDGSFDRLLPPLARDKSRQYWSPLCVARRAALRFIEHGARRILDVGSGPGKFCIAAAAAHPGLQLCGIEQRAELVECSIEIASRLRLRNLEFRAGNALSIPWDQFDGFYFFNPFAENRLAPDEVFDETVELSRYRLGVELLRVVELLSSLRKGAVVVTYCGLGGPIPSSYELLSEETVGSDRLRTWIKKRSYEAGWYHLDHQDDVSRAPRKHVERKLQQRRLRLGTAAE